MSEARFFAAARRIASTAAARIAGTLVVLYTAGAMLLDAPSGALRVSGVAFGAALALASGAFSYSRTVHYPAIRSEVTFSGERLLQSALTFLVASLFKYASDAVPRHALAFIGLLDPSSAESRHGLDFFVPLLCNALAFILCFVGALEFQSGALRLAAIAAHPSRRSGHADYVSAKAYERALDQLIAVDVAGAAPEAPPKAPT